MKINIGAGRFKKVGWTRIDHHSYHYPRPNEIDMDFLDNQKFPIPDNSVEAAYCSHVIEHLPENIVSNLILETFRVLKPGGVFRITCPDAWKGLNAMVLNQLSFFHMYQEYDVFNADEFKRKYSRTIALKDSTIYQQFMYMVMSPKCVHIDVPCKKITDEKLIELFETLSYAKTLDKICEPVEESIYRANPWMHITWWGVVKLINLLNKSGFRFVYQSACGESAFDEMRNIKHFDKIFPDFSLFVEAAK